MVWDHKSGKTLCIKGTIVKPKRAMLGTSLVTIKKIIILMREMVDGKNRLILPQKADILDDICLSVDFIIPRSFSKIPPRTCFKTRGSAAAACDNAAHYFHYE